MSHEAKLSALGITVPQPPPAGGNYLPFVQVGNLLYLAGVICSQEGKMTHTGQVGRDHTVETAAAGAKVCALNILANIRAATGSLDRVKRFVTLAGYVNAVSGFADSPLVINGASDFLVQVFGDAGRHARAAVAVAGLPKNSTVEIQAIVELV
jgi:enamine deaminase RidA (YjgF/YER057c/UK114 family)